MKRLLYIAKLTKTVLILNLICASFTSVLFARQDMESIKKLVEESYPVDIQLIKRPRVVYDAGNLRDPFITTFKEEEIIEVSGAPVEEKVALPPLEVQGIVSGPNFSQAIVNGKILKIGDTIENANIIDIDKEKVVVLFKSKQFTLSSPVLDMLEKLQKHKKEGEKNEE